MRQEGVRVASGRRQDNLASRWRQDDVKLRGARIKYRPYRPERPLEIGAGGGATSANGVGKMKPGCGGGGGLELRSRIAPLPTVSG